MSLSACCRQRNRNTGPSCNFVSCPGGVKHPPRACWRASGWLTRSTTRCTSCSSRHLGCTGERCMTHAHSLGLGGFRKMGRQTKTEDLPRSVILRDRIPEMACSSPRKPTRHHRFLRASNGVCKPTKQVFAKLELSAKPHGFSKFAGQHGCLSFCFPLPPTPPTKLGRPPGGPAVAPLRRMWAGCRSSSAWPMARCGTSPTAPPPPGPRSSGDSGDAGHVSPSLAFEGCWIDFLKPVCQARVNILVSRSF